MLEVAEKEKNIIFYTSMISVLWCSKKLLWAASSPVVGALTNYKPDFASESPLELAIQQCVNGSVPSPLGVRFGS